MAAAGFVCEFAGFKLIGALAVERQNELTQGRECPRGGRRLRSEAVFGEQSSDGVPLGGDLDPAHRASAPVPATGMPDAAPIGSNTTLKHDIPAADDCLNCHGKLQEHLLGFGAIQLSHDEGGLTLASLATEGLLSVSPPAGGYPVPGDAVDRAALGYLHANCGGCHNDTGIVRPTPWRLRLLVAAKTVETTDTYQTGVNVLHNWAGLGSEAGIFHRIRAGSPETSELAYRINIRGLSQMPPLGTKLVDRSAVAALSTWILRLKGPVE